MRTIFISHSSSPPAKETRQQKNDRLRSIEVRDAIKSGLDEAGWDVFFDEDEVNRTTRLSDDLFRCAATCAVAVVIISPRALQSPWVLQECVIFMLRAARSNFAVIPVLVGVTRRDLDASMLAVTQVNDTWKIEGATEAELVERTLAKIEEMPSASPDDKAHRWLIQLRAAILELRLDAVQLEAVAKELKPGDDKFAYSVDPEGTLAAILLDADYRQFDQAFKRIREATQSPQAARLLALKVRPLWVPVSCAAKILDCINKEKPRAVIVRATNSAEPRDVVPKDYVRRANADPHVQDAYWIETSWTKADDVAEEVASTLVPNAIARKGGKLEELKRRQIFLLLPRAEATNELLDALHAEFPNAVFVLTDIDPFAHGLNVRHEISPEFDLDTEAYYLYIAETICQPKEA